MIEESIQTPELASGIASAPGDLPMPAIEKRHASKAVQFRHDNTISPFQPTPTDPVVITATSGAVLNISRAELWYTTDGTWPTDQSHRIPMTQHTPIWEVHTSYLNQWRGTIPPQPDGTTVRYKIAGYTNDGLRTHFAHDGTGFWFNVGEAGITTFAYRVRQAPKHLPQWMDDAVIYHIFVDRFRGDDGQLPPHPDPNAKHGGTLQGIIDALPYVHELGFNCIWLSPVCVADTYHRYDQRSFVEIDPDLGSEADMRRLVSEAHALGIRLILDYVPSHASWHIPEFLAAQADQTAPSYSWFVFDEWPHKYRCFLNLVPFLVSFDGNSDGARQFLIDSALYWVRDMGFDGLRLDHAIGHGMDFWTEFSQALEEANPDVAIFGEATDTPDALKTYNGRLQGLLDFPLAQALRMSFGLGKWTVSDLSGMMNTYTQFMADGPARVSFFDNHDMDRFLYVANQDVRRLKMALLCLLTLPHTPILYYGTEVGMSQTGSKNDAGFGGDHLIREDMPWDAANWHEELVDFTKAAIGLRHKHKTLRNGRFQSAYLNTEKQLWGYKLVTETATLHVYFNLSEQAQQFTPKAAHTAVLLSTNESNTLSVNGSTMTLAGLSGMVVL